MRITFGYEAQRLKDERGGEPVRVVLQSCGPKPSFTEWNSVHKNANGTGL